MGGLGERRIEGTLFLRKDPGRESLLPLSAYIHFKSESVQVSAQVSAQL